MSAHESSTEWVGIGGRLRHARTAAGMSVRELARRIGVSASHVSQVERGLASFSVRALYNAVSVLGITMDSLFEAPAAAGGDAAGRPSQAAEVVRGPLDASLVVLRAGSRPTIPLPGGTRWERLTPRPEVGAEFIEVIYHAGQEAPELNDFARHSSREYGLITQGALTVQVGFDQTVLWQGDSIAFDSHVPHRFWNATADEVRAVWFILEDDRSGEGRTPLHAHADGQPTPPLNHH